MTKEKPLQLCLVGASGRTGSLILSVLPEFPQFNLTAAIVSPASKVLNCAVPHSAVQFTDNLSAGIAASDVVINFSAPAATTAAVTACVEHHRPLLIATTGLSAEQSKQIEAAARKIPICVASNTSIGIFVLSEVAALAQRLIGPTFDVEILEIHHKHKKDAPSGTALSLAGTLGGHAFVQGRSALSTPRVEGEIGVESLRGGDVAGEHTIYFLGDGERLELTHRATDRRIFARGALRMALALASRGAGMYSVKQLITT